MSTATTTPPPVPVLWHAFGGIWRMTAARLFTARHLVFIAGLLALLGLIGFAFVSARNGPRMYLNWMAGFYVTFLVPIVAFLTAAGAMRDEMKPATVDYVSTRPLPKPAFIVFKYLAHVACAELELLVGLAVLAALGGWFRVPGIGAALPLLAFGQILLVAFFSAFGLFAGVLTSRYFIVGLVYGAIVEIGIGQIPTQLNRISMIHQAKAMFGPVIPYLARGEALVNPGKLATATVMLLFSAGLVAISAALHALAEQTGPAE